MLRQAISAIKRLAQVFALPKHQSDLEQYLSTKGITDAAQLDGYIQQFYYNSHKGHYK